MQLPKASMLVQSKVEEHVKRKVEDWRTKDSVAGQAVHPTRGSGEVQAAKANGRRRAIVM